jgi:PAS domain S-box-containing protein
MNGVLAKILVVDDLYANRVAMRRLLKEIPAEILEAGSGTEALGVAIEHDLALILLDVSMPDMSGYELADTLHSVRETAHIPIIFVTAAFRDIPHMLQGYRSGGVDYLEKPVDDAVLLAKVRVFLELYLLRREREQMLVLLRQREAQTAAERTRYRTLLQSAADGICILDRDGRVVEVNPAFARLLGYVPEQLVHQTMDLWYPEWHGDTIHLQVRAMMDTAPTLWGAQYRHRSGERIRVEVNTQCINIEGQPLLHMSTRDVTDRWRAEQAVRQAHAAADAANRAKSAFLATMSHEIRTPLNSILGMVDLLRDVVTGPEAHQYLTTLDLAGESLLVLINDVLDLSKIEAGGVQLERAVIDLDEFGQTVLTLFRPLLKDKPIDLELYRDPRLPPRVWGDPVRLRQVCINLLSNAVKFTPAGRITFSMTQTAQGLLELAVQDSGIGIREDKLDLIFSPFTQADSSTTRHYGGTGLGLAICRNLVRLMGGEIAVTSSPQCGSRFFFVLPLEQVLQPPTDRAIAPLPELPTFHPAPRLPDPVVPAARSLEILLVDDMEDNRNLIAAYCKRTPHRLNMAESGAEAVVLFQQQKFDLVLMDIQMPVMDGYEATRCMRQHEMAVLWSAGDTLFRRTPIVALTAHATCEVAEAALAAGCDHYLTKPIRKQHLLELLERVAGLDGLDGHRGSDIRLG